MRWVKEENNHFKMSLREQTNYEQGEVLQLWNLKHIIRGFEAFLFSHSGATSTKDLTDDASFLISDLVLRKNLSHQ